MAFSLPNAFFLLKELYSTFLLKAIVFVGSLCKNIVHKDVQAIAINSSFSLLLSSYLDPHT
jgi:hypothetical protein